MMNTVPRTPVTNREGTGVHHAENHSTLTPLTRHHHSMPRRTPRTPNTGVVGRPSILDPALVHDLLEHIEDGQHITTACSLVGIGHSTLYRWLKHGEEAKTAAAAGHPLDDRGHALSGFVDRLARARGRAEKRAIDTVQRSMLGGFVISEEPIVDVDGVIQCDPATGQPLWKRTFSQPDGRLALEYLARMDPARFGRHAPTRVELTGADGGPVEVEHSVIVADLAQRVVAAKEQRRQDQLAGPIWDVDVVSDSEET